jgi:hypothetical protein
MAGVYLKMRLKQLYRELSNVGFFRVLLLLVFVGLAGLYLFKAAKSPQNASYLSIGFFLVLASLHFNRKDLTFMTLYISNYKWILFVEYLMLLAPVLVILATYNHTLPLLLLTLSTILLANLRWRPQKQAGSQWLVQHIPAQCFEWKAGIRQSGIIIVLFEIIALLASPFIGSIPIALFIIGLIPLNFYNYAEPSQILMASQVSPNRFLFQKIRYALMLYSSISLPLILLYIVVHNSLWYIPIIEFVAFSTVFCYVITLKYSFYEPNQRLDAVQAFSTLGAVSLLIPFFLPVIWLLTIRFYFKSKSRINYYLHDYN